jgi:hypothetical protein
MSNYTKATNFATKDTLPTGDSNKIVKGTEIDNEFNSISGAISSKADLASPTFTGTPAAPTATAGSNTTQLATTAFVTAALSAVYPVGSIYVNAAVSTNPATLLGFGTWAEFGAGRVMVGLNSSDALFDTLEETGGSKDAIVVEHTHTGTTGGQSADHFHNLNVDTGTAFYGQSTSGGPSTAGFTGDATTALVQPFTQYTSNDHTHNFTTASTGSSGTNANVQPFIVVKMWKRTA